MTFSPSSATALNAKGRRPDTRKTAMPQIDPKCVSAAQEMSVILSKAFPDGTPNKMPVMFTALSLVIGSIIASASNFDRRQAREMITLYKPTRSQDIRDNTSALKLSAAHQF